MKKIFSLVALAGMFTLMSFSFKVQKSEELMWCDVVDDVCLGAAADTVIDHGYSLDEAMDYWDACNSANGC